MTTWKTIPEANEFMVSNDGRIKRIVASKFTAAGTIMKTRIHNGYVYYNTKVNGKPKSLSIHRLVARMFISDPTDERPHVNHINCNKSDNDVNNLEWCSRIENAQHAKRNNKLAIGSKHGRSILDESRVRDIKLLILDNSITQTEIANKYNVSMATISRIKNNQRWLHV